MTDQTGELIHPPLTKKFSFDTKEILQAAHGRSLDTLTGQAVTDLIREGWPIIDRTGRVNQALASRLSEVSVNPRSVLLEWADRLALSKQRERAGIIYNPNIAVLTDIKKEIGELGDYIELMVLDEGLFPIDTPIRTVTPSSPGQTFTVTQHDNGSIDIDELPVDIGCEVAPLIFPS